MSCDGLTLSRAYELEEFYTSWSERAIKGHAGVFDEKLKFIGEPFPCGVLPSFLSFDQNQSSDDRNSKTKVTEFLSQLREELLGLDYQEKNNDLYQFRQSADLKAVNSPRIAAIRKLFGSKIRTWISKLVGVELNETVDLTASVYRKGNVLLPHDDELEDRRVAFVIYLSSGEWTQEDGGTLDLFEVDDNYQPTKIAESIAIQENTFVFFEVSPRSYHQVSEVVTSKPRISINGWFHGALITRPAPYIEAALPLQSWGAVSYETLLEWINPLYLSPEIQQEICSSFESDSEIELQNFLNEDKYNAVVDALDSIKCKAVLRGPPNRRKFHGLDLEEVKKTAVLNECLSVLTSEAMFLILSQLTGLSLHHMAQQNDAGGDRDGNEAGCSKTIANNSKNVRLSDDNGEEQADQENRSSKKPRLVDEIDADRSQENGSATSLTAAVVELEESPPKCQVELRCWRHGCYTLLSDCDAFLPAEFALDAFLFFGVEESWETDFGGYTCYLAKGEDEELITVTPRKNSLALVYRDQDSIRFVKYINSKFQERKGRQPEFADISLTFYEQV